VTSPSPESVRTEPAASPPPGCPAHIPADADALARLYGPAAQADPMGLYEQLRAEHGPVAPVLLEGDVPAWLVLGYRENMEVARTPALYSRDSRRWRDWKEGRIAPDSGLIPMMGWRPDCVSNDGQEHLRLRTAVTESLERFDRRGIRRYVHHYASKLIDDFAAAGNVELLTQYAQHVPMLVLTRLFGLPEEDGPLLVEACTELIKGTEKSIACNDYILETLRQLVARKRVTPGHDVASWLAAHPANLTDDEVQQHLRLVLIAANETTTNLIANTLRMVLTDPRFRASLTGGLMTVPDAVEQVLWDEPPLMVCPGRWATGDTRLGGRQIKSGDLLVLGLAAGNVDQAIRPDLTAAYHGNRSHLAFGRGPHECPGQEIGRAITDTAVDTLLARLPDIRLAVPVEELTWTSSTWSRHLDALPASFTPGRVAPAAAGASPVTVTGATPAASAVAPSVANQVQKPTQQPAAPAPVAAQPARRGFLARLFRKG
jgi:cytochrome P450